MKEEITILISQNKNEYNQIIVLSYSEFIIKAPNFKYKIDIDSDSILFDELKQTLQYFTKDKGKLIVL